MLIATQPYITCSMGTTYAFCPQILFLFYFMQDTMVARRIYVPNSCKLSSVSSAVATRLSSADSIQGDQKRRSRARGSSQSFLYIFPFPIHIYACAQSWDGHLHPHDAFVYSCANSYKFGW
ncbi:hypothetical protein B0H19DRAFT_1183145 [Mycena capillaripes]|nr:hypothetical protein B0H19DRAFT_1183145 [Mycena capillaripes]